jgi:hypothetical protein
MDQTSQFAVDLSALPPGVVAELQRGRLAREAMTIAQAPARQVEQARAHAGTAKSLDGLGRLRMVITADAYHYWGRRLGYECWRDKAFLREYERDNAAVRVKSRGTRIQVGYRGYAPARR